MVYGKKLVIIRENDGVSPNSTHLVVSFTGKSFDIALKCNFQRCYQEALSSDGLPKEDALHASLLIFNELLRISSYQCEKARVEIWGIHNDQPSRNVVDLNPIEFLIQQVHPNLVESRTAIELTTSRLPEVKFWQKESFNYFLWL